MLRLPLMCVFVTPLRLPGESNTFYNTDKYNCSFPAMINDWRMAFHQGSGGQTEDDFPFGFVQVSGISSVNLSIHPSLSSSCEANLRPNALHSFYSKPHSPLPCTCSSVPSESTVRTWATQKSAGTRQPTLALLPTSE